MGGKPGEPGPLHESKLHSKRLEKGWNLERDPYPMASLLERSRLAFDSVGSCFDREVGIRLDDGRVFTRSVDCAAYVRKSY